MRNPRVISFVIVLVSLLFLFILSNYSSPLFDRFGIKRPEFRQGLDLKGGVNITFKAETEGLASLDRDKALESAREVIERRVNLFGVSEPIVQTSKVGEERRIIVELPGVTDVGSAISLIGTTAKLSFWEESATSSAEPLASPSALQTLIPGISNPSPTSLTGEDLKSSSVVFDPNDGKPQVQLRFTDQGVKKFADITKRNVGKPVAIVLDSVVISAPVVEGYIPSGDAVITGSFTSEEAKALSTQLNAGALPVSLSVLEQHVIGPTLGAVSLQKSLFAGLIGFITIVIFMVALYGRLGIIASLALSIYTVIVLTIFKLSSLTPYGVTLTLAGIAGFILSIGMAVDANILIFERTKEELRGGRERSQAIDVGFRRAWTSIRDSNVSTIITSLILIYFGTGIVRGFAVVLIIGVLVSMFSAITVTRNFIKVLYSE
ncbi:MAG: protein translocase subunit SecD [Patescibacteria group bacterium]